MSECLRTSCSIGAIALSSCILACGSGEPRTRDVDPALTSSILSTQCRAVRLPLMDPDHATCLAKAYLSEQGVLPPGAQVAVSASREQDRWVVWVWWNPNVDGAFKAVTLDAQSGRVIEVRGGQ